MSFATSARSSVGLEWEIMLADGASGDLVPRAPEILDVVSDATALERYTVTGELLTNTVEVTSGIGDTVAAAVDDIADAIVLDKGLPFRTAHQIVAILVRLGISRGLTQAGGRPHG
ncbi:MAG: hypothetical protein J0I66_09830, partial [Microbacterium sp.]|nr:hypothetical protein [Microbacterium sp.]